MRETMPCIEINMTWCLEIEVEVNAAVVFGPRCNHHRHHHQKPPHRAIIKPSPHHHIWLEGLAINNEIDFSLTSLPSA